MTESMLSARADASARANLNIKTARRVRSLQRCIVGCALGLGRSARSCRSGQLTRDLARFLDLRGLAPTGFRTLAGLTVSGRPAPTGVTDGPGSGRNWARQPGL